jgi:archaellum biogenesis ATPase FlaH/biotin operon repressor
LWPDPATVEGNVLLVVEGEPDAVTGATLGLPAVAVPGAGKWRPEWAARLAQGRERVVVIPDADEPGRTAAQRVAAAVAEHCCDVRVLDLAPERDDGYDLSDYASLAQDDRERAQAASLLLRAAGDVPRQGLSGVNHLGGDNPDNPPSTANGGPPKPDRYAGRVLDVGHMLTEPDTPIPWRCHDLAADGYLTVLAGRGGEGKSWLALALASGVARGKPAAGIDCRQGRALIFDAENGPKLIARRFRAAEVTAALDVQPVDAGGLKLSKDLDWFRRTIVSYRANLVVFDSLRVLSSGAKESDGDEMEPLVTALKQLSRDTGAAVVLIHHRGKGETSEYRGSSVILDQTDMLYTLGRVAGDPEGRHRRKITTIKCRIEEEPAPRWVAIDADRSLGLVFVNAAEPYEPEDTGRPRDTLRDDVLAILTGLPKSGAEVARELGRHKSDQTIRRALGDLEADGLAVRGAQGWALPEWRPEGLSLDDPLGGDNPDNPSENPMDTGDQGLSGGLSPDNPDDEQRNGDDEELA